MKLLNTAFLTLSMLGSFALSQAAVTVAVDFGAQYSANSINSAGWQTSVPTPPVEYVTHDANFNGSATDRTQYVPLGEEHTAPNSTTNWITPEGKSGAVVRYGTSIANIGSTDNTTMRLVRFSGGAPQAFQNTSALTSDATAAMRMASAWYWEKSSFLNGADALGGLSFADQTASLSVGFLNRGATTEGVVSGRFMVQSDGVWYLSGDELTGTSDGTLSINAAASNWFSFDPLSSSLLFYDPSNLGTAVAGSALDSITAIGVHVQHELFDGTVNNAYAHHQFNSLQAVVIPEPATVSALLGLGALALVMIRRRARSSRSTMPEDNL
jgi:hypothetical protein